MSLMKTTELTQLQLLHHFHLQQPNPASRQKLSYQAEVSERYDHARARSEAWANWLEEHPRGAGNKGGSQL